MGDLTELRREVERWIKRNKKKGAAFYRKKGIKEKIHDAIMLRIADVDDVLKATGYRIINDVLERAFEQIGDAVTDEKKAQVYKRAQDGVDKVTAEILQGIGKLIDQLW